MASSRAAGEPAGSVAGEYVRFIIAGHHQHRATAPRGCVGTRRRIIMQIIHRAKNEAVIVDRQQSSSLSGGPPERKRRRGRWDTGWREPAPNPRPRHPQESARLFQSNSARRRRNQRRYFHLDCPWFKFTNFVLALSQESNQRFSWLG